MNAVEARGLVEWMIRWNRNALQDREFTKRDIATAADHYLSGKDPWESASAICEGRTL